MGLELASPRIGAASRGPLWPALTLPVTILLTLSFELVLAERKYGLFSGGFGQSRPLDTPVEIIVFFAGLIACQALALTLLYRLIRRLHGKRGDSPLFHLDFLFVAGGGMVGAAAAKYEALRYFSDAMSFQIVRNLGGGSLLDAFLFSLGSAGLIALALGGAAVAWMTLFLFVRRRWRDAAALPDYWRPRWRQLLLALAALPVLLFAANRAGDARPALARFNSVALAENLFHQLTDFDRDGWSWFTWPIDRQPFDATRHP
jgi:hypothetical protein